MNRNTNDIVCFTMNSFTKLYTRMQNEFYTQHMYYTDTVRIYQILSAQFLIVPFREYI